MRWNAKFTHVDYKQGSTRLKRIFAFIPTRIGDTYVWLESYEVLQVYQITPFQVVIGGETATFARGEWIEVSKRLMDDKPAAK